MGYWLLPLLAAIGNLILAGAVWGAARRSTTAKVFTFFSIVLTFWNLNFFSLYFFDAYEEAFYFARIFRVGAAVVPAVSFHLVATIRNRRSSFWTVAVYLNYAIALCLVIANLNDQLVVRLQPHPWGYYSVAGPAYSAFAAFLTLNMVACLVILALDYRYAEEPRVRTQLRFWLLGAALVIPLGLTNLMPAYGVPIYPLGNLGSAAFAAVVGYAIARYRLMDLDVVLTKGMAGSIASLIVFAPVFFFLYAVQSASYGNVHPDAMLACIIALAVVAIAFPTVLQRIEPGLHASLFPQENEYRSSLLSFTRTVTRILDQERLLRELSSTLLRSLRTTHVSIALQRSNNSPIVSVYSIGEAAMDREFEAGGELANFLRASAASILRDEVGGDSTYPPSILSVYERNGWEVCVPLRVGERLLGFIALGAKGRLESYSSQDLVLIEALAGEASIALDNARLYAELKQSHAMIERADRSSALGVLAAGIAHEIRNPLVSIQTFFQLAPDRLNDEEFSTTFLATAASEVRRISTLIDELMSFARSPNTTLGPVSLLDVVESVALLLGPEAKRRRVALQTHPAPQSPVVWGNEEQIRQVVLNLLLNAIHATDAGGSVRVELRRIEKESGSFGLLEICDTGSGIDVGDLDQVFHPFFTTKVSGTGLGLAIVQRIVFEHGGVISVASERGVGSTFTVEFPAAVPDKSDTNWNQELSETSK